MNQKLNQLSQKIRHPAIRQSALMSIGTGINSILGLVFYLLVIRSLSVGLFGEFSLLLTLGVLAAELGDLGIGSAILKYGHGANFSKMLSVAFYQRLGVGVLIFILCAIGQQITSLNLLLSAQIAFSYLLFSALNQAFLANEKYFVSVGVNIFANILRLILIAIIIAMGDFSVDMALGTYVGASLVGFLLFVALLPKISKFELISIKSAKIYGQTIFPFTWRIGASYAITALSAKIDAPMLFALAGPVQTGLYASAQKIAGVISQFAGVLDSVFAPKFSKSKDKSNFTTFFVLALIVSITILISIPFAPLFVTILFPESYWSGIGVLQILLLGYAIFFLSTPFASSTVYRFGKSELHLFNSTQQLLLTFVLFVLVLPRFGALGAAYVFAFVNTISLAIFFTTNFLLSRKNAKVV